MTKERTFIAIKSESIQRHLIGEIISRFERRCLKLVACKMVVPTEGQIAAQYPDEDWWYKKCGERTLKSRRKRGIEDNRDPAAVGRWVREMLLKDNVGKPLLAMVWEGANAVALGVKTVGHTNPLEADVGTIRGDFTVESYELADEMQHPVRTLVHASKSVEEAEKEINLYFEEEELVEYPLIIEDVLYGAGWGVVKKL